MYQYTVNFIYLLVEFMIVLELFGYLVSTYGLIRTDFFEVVRNAILNIH
jgi:hypothetical protein